MATLISEGGKDYAKTPPSVSYRPLTVDARRHSGGSRVTQARSLTSISYFLSPDARSCRQNRLGQSLADAQGIFPMYYSGGKPGT